MGALASCLEPWRVQVEADALGRLGRPATVADRQGRFGADEPHGQRDHPRGGPTGRVDLHIVPAWRVTEGADSGLTDAELRAQGRQKSNVLPKYAKRTMRQVAAGQKKRRAKRAETGEAP